MARLDSENQFALASNGTHDTRGKAQRANIYNDFQATIANQAKGARAGTKIQVARNSSKTHDTRKMQNAKIGYESQSARVGNKSVNVRLNNKTKNAGNRAQDRKDLVGYPDELEVEHECKSDSIITSKTKKTNMPKVVRKQITNVSNGMLICFKNLSSKLGCKAQSTYASYVKLCKLHVL